jgi:glycosyltransferase involved in cell wall biosynthesis
MLIESGLRPHLASASNAPFSISVWCRNRLLSVQAFDGPDGGAAAPQEQELISCVMVTRGRLALAQRAIRCFQQQTHPNRELVILDGGTDDHLFRHLRALADARIVYRRDPQGERPLGEMRNAAIACTSGPFVCQWDDDDLYHPRRIELQIAALRATGSNACFLQREYIWWPAQDRLAQSVRRIWEPSMLCEKAFFPAYPPLARGEDTAVTEAIVHTVQVVLLDAPELYIYVVHGANTCPSPHFEDHWKRATARFVGEAYRERLEAILSALPADVRG